jgi:hypothetical protein
MEKKLLILTNTQDGINTLSVMDHIDRAGIEVFRYDSDIMQIGELAISALVNPDGVLGFVLKDNKGNSCKIDEVGAAWYRRPNTFGFDQASGNNSLELAISDELKEAQQAWFGTVPDDKWLNNPKEMRKINPKIQQLVEANRAGFNTPPTLVTNDSEAFREFLETYRKIVLKSFRPVFFQDKQEDTPRMLFTTVIDIDTFDDYELVKNMPILLQKYIDKDYELRITVVEDQIFVSKVVTSEKAKDDWRKHQFTDEVSFEIAPNEDQQLLERCIEFVKSHNLKYGVFDIIHDKSGVDHFLELNTNGQWYWLEHSLGFPISKAIADSLIRIYQQNN